MQDSQTMLAQVTGMDEAFFGFTAVVVGLVLGVLLERWRVRRKH